MHDKLVTKMNNIDTSDFASKVKYDTDKAELENKIHDTSGIVKKKTNYNTKTTELENKLPDISNLATKTALTTVENEIPDVTNLATKPALSTLENKIPDVSSLIKKTDYDTRVAEIHPKIPDVSSLIKKTDYDTRVAEIHTKVSSLDGKIAKNKNELIKNIKEVTEIGVLSLFMGNAMFEGEGGCQAYLIFQPVYKYFKTITNTNYISS